MRKRRDRPIAKEENGREREEKRREEKRRGERERETTAIHS